MTFHEISGKPKLSIKFLFSERYTCEQLKIIDKFTITTAN